MVWPVGLLWSLFWRWLSGCLERPWPGTSGRCPAFRIGSSPASRSCRCCCPTTVGEGNVESRQAGQVDDSGAGDGVGLDTFSPSGAGCAAAHDPHEVGDLAFHLRPVASVGGLPLRACSRFLRCRMSSRRCTVMVRPDTAVVHWLDLAAEPELGPPRPVGREPDRHVVQRPSVKATWRVARRARLMTAAWATRPMRRVQHPHPVAHHPRLVSHHLGVLQEPLRPLRTPQPVPLTDQHRRMERHTPSVNPRRRLPSQIPLQPVTRLPVRQPLKRLEHHHRRHHPPAPSTAPEPTPCTDQRSSREGTTAHPPPPTTGTPPQPVTQQHPRILEPRLHRTHTQRHTRSLEPGSPRGGGPSTTTSALS